MHWSESQDEFNRQVELAMSGRKALEMPSACGIYFIANRQTGFIYVGASENMRRRAQCHMSRLRSGVHENVLLASAFNAHGEQEFRFHVLEECSIDEARSMEWKALYMMDLCRTYNMQCLYGVRSERTRNAALNNN